MVRNFATFYELLFYRQHSYIYLIYGQNWWRNYSVTKEGEIPRPWAFESPKGPPNSKCIFSILFGQKITQVLNLKTKMALFLLINY